MALAAPQPVRSLNDLPMKWAGIAGDLLKKVDATFVVEKIESVEREDKPGSFEAVYSVSAAMTLGDRIVKISKITLRGSSDLPNPVEMLLTTDDELAGVLLAVVVYDEASNTYTLKEIPNFGMARRFVLQGAK